MLRLQRPRSLQPQDATPVRAASNLVGYWPFNYGGGGAQQDVVGVNNARLANTATHAISPFGRCIALDGSTGAINFGAAAALKPASFTWSYWIRPRTISKAYAALLTCTQDLGVIANTLYLKSNGKLAQYFARTGSVNAVYDGTGVHTLSVGNSYNLCSTYESVSGVARTYVNGVLDGTATMSTPGSIPLSAGTVVYFSFDALTANREFHCHAGNFSLFNAALTAEQVRRLYLHPWQLFAPQTQRIWTYSTAGSSLPTLSAPTFVPGSITSSGFTGRVTAA